MTSPASPRRGRRLLTWLVGGGVAALVLVVGGTWVYINVLRDDAPDRLEFTDTEAAAESADTTVTTTAPPTTAPATTAAGGEVPDDPSGTWVPGPGSVAGYRVAEILFGQSVEAVGRTDQVAGSVAVDGTTVTAAEIVVDLATVESDDSRRDGQFRGRIMDVASFPTATFALGAPVELGRAPDGDELAVSAPGELTLRGVTRPATAELRVRAVDDAVEVLAEIPVVFTDHDIPEPSVPGIDVEDEGLIEVRLVLTR